MHTFDIIVLVITAFFVVIGIKRGFVIEIFRLVAMIAGFIIAFLYYSDIKLLLPLGKLPLQAQNSISFILTYIVTAIAIIAIGWVAKKIIHFSMLGWLDRILGAGVGVSKALIIVWVACLSIAAIPSERVRNDFGKSISFQLYKSLPNGLELEGISSIRNAVRKVYTAVPHKKVKTEAETESKPEK
ncbi:MAG TPA: CvpA family protein [Chitinispirillaceae bacterium]|nr:CvpA family protein [Chitinispirillaceae bacterium]